MTTKITTDWHIGVSRSAGTTPATQTALREHIREAFKAQLDDQDHLVCGDLFNDFTIDTHEVVATYMILAEWLTDYSRKLALLRGNHDFHQSGSKMSSFDLLGHILSNQFPEQVTIVSEVTEWKNFILVPHLPNNDLLNLEVEKLKGVQGKVIAFHCNIDNYFTEGSQHSLNLSLDQVNDIVSRGNLIICGHEHQYRTLVNGRCLVLGNGTPSSIADCLGNDHKYAATVVGTDYTLTPIWSLENNFAEINWCNINGSNPTAKFCRVTGNATAAEAEDVINAIAKFRQASDAFVITNAVKIEGMAEIESMAGFSLETVKSFDVMAALLAQLEPDEAAVIKEIMQ